MAREREMQAFARLLDIMDQLREKCPWDRKQTFGSLRPQTIEEAYELSDAILNGDRHEIAKELGDVLLHVVFYAKLGSEEGAFDVVEVINLLCDKLIYRHPHVFGEVEVASAGDVVKNWEQLKRSEKDGNKTVLSGVPATLPPLIKAYRMQDKARAVGFDWQDREDVWGKVREEIAEFETELKRGAEDGAAGNARAEAELGDLLFALVNAARLYDLNPDTALESSCNKFRARFNYVEARAKELGRDLASMTLQEMDLFWEDAKELGL